MASLRQLSDLAPIFQPQPGSHFCFSAGYLTYLLRTLTLWRFANFCKYSGVKNCERRLTTLEGFASAMTFWSGSSTSLSAAITRGSVIIPVLPRDPPRIWFWVSGGRSSMMLSRRGDRGTGFSHRIPVYLIGQSQSLRPLMH